MLESIKIQEEILSKLEQIKEISGQINTLSKKYSKLIYNEVLTIYTLFEPNSAEEQWLNGTIDKYRK